MDEFGNGKEADPFYFPTKADALAAVKIFVKNYVLVLEDSEKNGTFRRGFAFDSNWESDFEESGRNGRGDEPLPEDKFAENGLSKVIKRPFDAFEGSESWVQITCELKAEVFGDS